MSRYSQDQQRIDDLNRDEPEEHSWDHEIDRLHAQDEHDHPARRPPGTIAAQSPKAWARYLAYLDRTGRPHPTHADQQEEEEE